jgi:hypothetical protein
VDYLDVRLLTAEQYPCQNALRESEYNVLETVGSLSGQAMKWLIKRLLVIFVTLSICCSAAVVLGWLDHSPSNLQTLGLICAEEPCFRGVKIGTDRATVQQLFPDVTVNGNFVQIPSNLPAIISVAFDAFNDGKAVDRIGVERLNSRSSLLINVGDVIARYGIPCRVGLVFQSSAPHIESIRYPTMTIHVDTTSNVYGNGLQPNSVISVLRIENYSYVWGACGDPILEYAGPWHGFISAQAYYQHNLNDLSMIQPTNVNP